MVRVKEIEGLKVRWDHLNLNEEEKNPIMLATEELDELKLKGERSLVGRSMLIG